MPFSILDFIWIIPALPLLAFAINGLFGRMLGRTTGMIAVVLVGLTFILSLWVLVEIFNRDPHAAPFQYTLYTWIPSGDFRVSVAFLIDPLTAVMLLVVTSVGYSCSAC
jgi:NADH-quinone oxidoreductase subunit L